MKVLVLGFCRTGTASMRAALATLGYGAAHHIGRVMNDPREVDAWRAAIEAKFYEKGTPISGQEQWDAFFGDLQIIADVPGILFAEELIQAYPEAQIILTTRDPDRWWRSFRETLLVILGNKQTRLARWLDPFGFGKFVPFARLNLEVLLGPLDTLDESAAKKRYAEYYANIRGLAQNSSILEYQMGEGWGSLCAFLGKDVPEAPFPHKNDASIILDGSHRQIRAIYWRAATTMVIPGAFIALAFVFAYLRRK